MGVEDWGARCRVLRLRAGVMGWKEGEEASNDGETQRVFDKYIVFTEKVFTLEKRVRAGLGFWKEGRAGSQTLDRGPVGLPREQG